MNILVTGGAGYIGSTLVPMLLAAGHRVVVLDALRYGAQHATALAAVAHDPNFAFVRGDIRDIPSTPIRLADFDAIIHLAALVGAPLCDRYPEEAKAVNAEGTRILVSQLSKNQLFLYPCSQSGYGRTDPGAPPVTEAALLNPLSLYGRTKVYGEEFALAHPLGTSLRLATLYGAAPRMRTDLLVNDFVLRAYRDGALTLFEAHHRRAVLHVRDAARAFVHALTEAVPAQRAYNVVGENVTKRQICVKIQEFLPNFAWEMIEHRVDPDQRDYVVSGRAFADTGFAVHHFLHQGIPELLQLYAAFPPSAYGNV